MLWWIIKGLLPWCLIFRVVGVWAFIGAYMYFVMWRWNMKELYDCGACPGNGDKYTLIGVWILFSSFCTWVILSCGC